MEVIFIVLPLAIGMAGVALMAFLWSVKRGQLDDLDTPPCRMLFEDTDQSSSPASFIPAVPPPAPPPAEPHPDKPARTVQKPSAA